MTPDNSPLAEIETGAVLFPVLRAFFHLEILEPEDATRIERANGIILDWLGDKFGVSWLSFWNEIERFRPKDFEYAAQYATSLRAPVGSTDEETILLQNLAKNSHDEFQVTITGSRTSEQGSPFSYRFWSEIPEVGLGDHYHAHATLSVSVPTNWPLADFSEHVIAIASCLRLRWGSAGFSYSDWIPFDYRIASERRFAHARRFSGFDVGEYIQLGHRWHNEIRTVNWLTWLGPAFIDTLKRTRPDIRSTPLIDVSESPAAMLLRAGAKPMTGDVNRREYPIAYVAADELVRPIRANTAVEFGDPWDELTSETWLRRFESV